MDPAHPFGVTGGEILVHRHHVHAPPVEGVEVGRKCRHQGLALTGLHLGDPPEVQGHAAHQLHVEVALPEHPPGRLAHHGEGLDGEVVERLALVEALTELDRHVAQLVVAQRLHLGLEAVNWLDQLGEAPDLLALAGAQNLGEHTHGSLILPAPDPPQPTGATARRSGLRAADLVFDPTLACREGDAPAPAARWLGHRALRHRFGAHRLVSARPRQPGTRRAGLTSKPHHAQRPQVALRGSFCLRLASTFNHRPARSPQPLYGRLRRSGRPDAPPDRDPGVGQDPGTVRRRPGGVAVGTGPSVCRSVGYWPGTLEPVDPEGEPALSGVAPSRTVTSEIFQVPPTFARLMTRRTTSAWGVVILLLT